MKITMIGNKFSKEFKEKLLILIVTSLVTGILIPIITARIGEVRAEREKKLEAELKHQASIIHDQNELLKRLHRLLTAFSKNGHDLNPPMNTCVSSGGFSQTDPDKFPSTTQVHSTDSFDDLY